MHVTILALGSHGDVWPYALLGGALRRAGHGVRLATFAGFAGMAEAQELALHPVEGDAATLMQSGGGLPPEVFGMTYAPYDWLFPRMRAVVHHGGAGTTAAGLRAGVPSLAVPFLFDQFFWGERLRALGVGPPPLPFKGLTAIRLAQAISRMVEDQAMQRRAATLGETIAAEAGLTRAVDLVEQFV